MCVTNKSKEQRQTTLVRLTGQKRTGAVQPPDAENRMSGGVEGRGAKSPLPHPIELTPAKADGEQRKLKLAKSAD